MQMEDSHILDDDDTTIGLDVRGQVFYCSKSKLLNVNTMDVRTFLQDFVRIACWMQTSTVWTRKGVKFIK